MNDYGAATYGDRIAPVYDQLHPGTGNDTPEVRALAGLAGGGRALELGIGTGRVALPLAERGVAVHGIDASEAMAAKLRAKPGGSAIPVVIGDFAEVPADGTFSLVFAVLNTFFALTTQEAQVRCFRRVAEHLSDDGVFLIQVFVPDPARFAGGQRLGVSGVDTDSVTLEVARHDPLQQRVYSQNRGAGRVRNPPLPGADSIRVAPRAGLDGAPRRPVPARPLERLDRRPVHG